MPNKFIDVLSSFLPTMFLVCKFHQYKRQQQESNRKKITEKELSHLNHKIDKLLNKLEEHDSELASTPDEECVICISAKATMQTFPCGHRVVCRKCFVKTIQVAVSQRLLPLRCVICRAKILRLKQTSQGGIDTGTVLRSHVSAVTAGHHHHHHRHGRTSLASSPSPSSSSTCSSSSSTTGSSSIASPLTNNPFFISPITSPVSPVTEVFREQRAVWARNFDSFGYEVTGQSPISGVSSPLVSTPTVSSESNLLKTDLNLGSGCVLHKHCIGKHSLNGNDGNNSGTSPCSTRDLSDKICSPSTSSSLSSPLSSSLSSSSCSSKSPSIISGFLSSSFAVSSSTTSSSSPSYSDPLNQSSPSEKSSPSSSSSSSSFSSSFTPICPTAPNPWSFQINRKRRHRLAHRRRRGHYVPSGRPTSLLLPIDEKDEWHNEDNSSDHEMVQKGSNLDSTIRPSSSSSLSYNYRSKRKQLSNNYGSFEDGEDENVNGYKEDEKLNFSPNNQENDENDYSDEDDDDDEEDYDDDDENVEEKEEKEEKEKVQKDGKKEDVGLMYEESSLDDSVDDSRRDSIKFLLDSSQSRSSIGSTSPINHFTSSSRLSTALMKAKNLVSRGKWRTH